MSESFENMAYCWEMFLIEHFRKVKELHFGDYESYIIMQVINSHFIYNKKKDKYKKDQHSWNDIFSLASSDYSEKIINEKNKLTISSISRVCSLPLETTRRKLQKLCELEMIKITKNSISLGKKHNELWLKIGAEETKVLRSFFNSIKDNGALKWLDSEEAKEIIKKIV